jgi:hypothetical protein
MLRPNPQSAFSETKCFKDLYFQAGALGPAYTAECSENAVIERRPFRSLSGDRCDWLQAKHHFSPADANSGRGPLRFWNDDEIAPNSGFPHMLTRTWKSSLTSAKGAVTHRDSLGNTARIVAGDVRVMSAGTGTWHAEFNLEPQTTIGDSCRITLHQLADCLLYRRSTALWHTQEREYLR